MEISDEKFNKLSTDVELIKNKLDYFTEAQKEKVDYLYEKTDKNEDRIRVLEDFKSKAVGGMAVAGLLGGFIGALLQLIFGK